MMYAGIDMGGTKIEARLFDDDWKEIARHRIATPKQSYQDLLVGIAQQVDWLASHGDVNAVGLGSPGLIHPETGVMLTANLPASGHRLEADISQLCGRDIALIKDNRAFTLSEAALGAGAKHGSVVGLILGTGVAGGHALSGGLVPDFNGQNGEYGHLPLPAEWVQKHGMPLVSCGCGLMGCFETYLAGPGLGDLAQVIDGVEASPKVILSDPQFAKSRAAWFDLAAHMIAIIARAVDPEIVVLGGGVGMADGLPEGILGQLDGKLLANTKAPKLVQAMFDDASGALGAAFFAKRVLDAKS